MMEILPIQNRKRRYQAEEECLGSWQSSLSSLEIFPFSSVCNVPQVPQGHHAAVIDQIPSQRSPFLYQNILTIAPPMACNDDSNIFSNMVVFDRYLTRNEVGRGTFGVCFSAWDSKRNVLVAMKVVRRDERSTEDALVEAGKLNILARREGASRYCVQPYTHFHAFGHLCIVTELLGDNLHHALQEYRTNGGRSRGVRMEIARKIAKDLCEALDFLNKAGLVHADLKTENVVMARPGMTLDDPTLSVKLIDFGCASWNGGPAGTVVQTSYYRAPEVLLGLEWSYPCDMWSVGCIVLEMFEGERTFETIDPAQHLAMIQRLCGKLPSYMIQRSGAAVSYCIDKLRSRVMWPEVSGGDICYERNLDKEKAVMRVLPLFQRLGHPGLVHMLGFLLGTFQLDPSFRTKASSAIHCRWFDDNFAQMEFQRSSKSAKTDLSSLPCRTIPSLINSAPVPQLFGGASLNVPFIPSEVDTCFSLPSAGLSTGHTLCNPLHAAAAALRMQIAAAEAVCVRGSGRSG
uniref:Protein kinase domain-containing protein n=1 Tax=Hanusia phi TaxID=3032 RepID=A0A7S0HAX4_9CRYP|mmetsp:Transcript_10990/g.24927  ORF Transcript_10990/g.24927 Transcript_10990/m.24927 type:complete len:516 (+) Transcript_10990:300-1847(+)